MRTESSAFLYAAPIHPLTALYMLELASLASFPVQFEGTGTSLSRGASAKQRPPSATAAASPRGSARAASAGGAANSTSMHPMSTRSSSRAAVAEPEKEFTLAIIKPDAVAAGHADAIFAKVACQQ